MVKALTAKFVEKAKTSPARQEMPDGALPGFYLIVQPSGAKSWALRYRYAGKTKKLTIGTYPKLQLGEAREIARESFLLIEKGKDPAALRKGSEAPADKSIEDIARRFVQQYVMHVNRPKTQIERARILGLKIERDSTLTLRNNANSVIGRWGKRSVSSISGRDVVDLIDGIFEQRKPIMANRTLALIKRLFSWAVGKKYLSSSPCEGVEAPGKENKRRRVLKPDELRAVWKAAERLGWPAGAAYRLLILSGQRKSQVSLARLEDFDLKEKLWTIPPEREGTKGEDAHVLPITAEIEGIVRACPHSHGYLFSTTGGEKPLTIGDKLKRQIDKLALEELRREAAERGDDPSGVALEDWTNHDLRRTMRTGLSSLAIPEGDLVRELVIGHKQKGVHAIYDVHQYLDEKRIALELWAAKVRSISDPTNKN